MNPKGTVFGVNGPLLDLRTVRETEALQLSPSSANQLFGRGGVWSLPAGEQHPLSSWPVPQRCWQSVRWRPLWPRNNNHKKQRQWFLCGLYKEKKKVIITRQGEKWRGCMTMSLEGESPSSSMGLVCPEEEPTPSCGSQGQYGSLTSLPRVTTPEKIRQALAVSPEAPH